MTQPDQQLDRILHTTLGRGSLPVDRKRRHRERLGLPASPIPSTMPANVRFPSGSAGNEFRTITSTTGGGLRDRLELITIIAVITLVIGGVIASRMFLAGDEPEEPAIAGVELTEDFDVYVRIGGDVSPAGQALPGTFVQVDPDTLEDRTDSPEISGARLIASRGMPVLVSIEYPDRMPNPLDGDPSDGVRIVILDTQTGKERSSFHAPAFVQTPYLSPDGSKLVVQTVHATQNEELPSWWILDTNDGSVISTINDDPVNGQEELFFSADSSTLYRVLLVFPTSSNPMSLQIIAYDVATGSETNRRAFDSIQIEFGQLPGVATSPDGRQLAIAHADAKKITIISLEQLTIEQSFAFSATGNEPEKWINDPNPRSLHLQAEFSLDGRYLYISGSSIEKHLGLTAVNLERRELMAHAFDGVSVVAIIPAPDGQSIYASRYDDPVQPPAIIYRLHPETLEILAERESPVYGGVIINPVVLPADETVVPDATSEDPLEFIFAYRQAVDAGDLDAAREVFVEPFREFSDEVLFLGESGRHFSWDPDDWSIEQHERFTVLRLTSHASFEYVLRQTDQGWRIDGGLEALWLMQRRENDDFDRFPGAYQDIRIDQMSDHDAQETGLHLGISVAAIELHDDNTMDVAVEWRVTGAATAGFPLEGLNWVAGEQSGDVEITWGTMRLTEDQVDFPIPADPRQSTVMYSANLTLHDIPDSGDLRLHMPWITLTNAAGEERTISAILHLPVADYPPAE